MHFALEIIHYNRTTKQMDATTHDKQTKTIKLELAIQHVDIVQKTR